MGIETISFIIFTLALAATNVWREHRHDAERTTWNDERKQLLDRLQFPDRPVRAEGSREPVAKPRVIDVDDDQAFAVHYEGMNGDGQ